MKHSRKSGVSWLAQLSDITQLVYFKQVVDSAWSLAMESKDDTKKCSKVYLIHDCKNILVGSKGKKQCQLSWSSLVTGRLLFK